MCTITTKCCSRCKKEQDIDMFKSKRDGSETKQCLKCRTRNICEHKKYKSQCRECGGSSICEHNKQKSHCRECGGSSFCKHEKQKSQCIECGGSSICKHEKQKSQCRECDGSSICEHEKYKSQCRECGGSSFCEHNKQKSHCRECDGSSFCEHEKQKSQCIECGGSSICKHKKQKSQCRECGGSSLCPGPCGGKYGNPKYDGYCTTCFPRYFPTDERCATIRTNSKEIKTRQFIEAEYTGWIHDKSIQTPHCDCTIRRRPDHYIFIDSSVLAVETDEFQHRSYDSKDEVDRYYDNYMAYSGKWVYIRFNPDSYKGKDGSRKDPSFKYRSRILKQEIDKHIARIKAGENTELIERIELFYDGYD